ncbi:8-amino-7-oxononanoate synthase [Tenacibaculum maritimum]|uniref:aminotransferase class I/II-fold pyridoxal phosphate-dependent enzyme n=1 Tax=Tenacibaculum maritimum TaxID=107401 RepID=UPI0012E59DEC|nr:pyridoxal phosphate-dependent aminotransferase family protein [Tenacibaculum maritimum]CAA0210328.1 8-amino-7-oxononanoate synthase [Tenacibaculum maritimum]
MKFPKKLQQKLLVRKEHQALRFLSKHNNLIDFSSNDYLGFAKSEYIFHQTHQLLIDKNTKNNGATGSRLLSGNHSFYESVEGYLCDFHNAESSLIFNSGYDANIGFFSSIPQRGDIILYDELIHASIRDGIRLSNAKSYKFKHNDLKGLENKITSFSSVLKEGEKEIYVVTEAVFSMDGDLPNLTKMTALCNKNNVHLIVDEAHSLGVFGNNGCGLVQALNLEKDIFARIITFGKALGCHGAVIVGCKKLKQYLINFARSFIYTTGLSPHSLATIFIAYKELNSKNGLKKQALLKNNIAHFKEEVNRFAPTFTFIQSTSAIQCCIIPGNEKVKEIAKNIALKGYHVKPILSPTVRVKQERLRFCLHSYNSKEEITNVLEILTTFASV